MDKNVPWYVWDYVGLGVGSDHMTNSLVFHKCQIFLSTSDQNESTQCLSIRETISTF